MTLALALWFAQQLPRNSVGLKGQSACQIAPSLSAKGLALYLLLVMAGLVALQQGCGIAGGSSASVSASIPAPTPIPPANIAGGWSISTTSSKFPAQTTIAGTIAQNGSNISGSLDVSGSSCAKAAILSGSLNANAISASLTENGQIVALTGNVSPDANSASGSYTAESGGCTNGDAGTWTASRTAVVSNPNGTPAGAYPLGVIATSGGVSHRASITLTVM
jgi:hypothetical protein